MSSKVYYKNLDALRAIAALIVVFYHICIRFISPVNNPHLFKILSLNNNGGWIGVYLFFALSGFLITKLLFLEYEQHNKISLYNFYLRRILRIWPLYFLSLFIGFKLYPVLVEFVYNKTYVETANFWYYLFFVANFDHILNAIPTIPILGVQWSVCIEEQFYLFWPLVIVLFRKKYFLAVFSIALFLFYFFSSGLSYSNIITAYYSTIPAFICISFGAIGAYLFHFHKNGLISFFKKIKVFPKSGFYFLGGSLILFKHELSDGNKLVEAAHLIISSSIFTFFILDLVLKINPLLRIHPPKFFIFLGKISYGIYLLHMVPIVLIMTFKPIINLPVYVNILIVLATTSIFATTSYYLLEKPFLRLKKKYSVL